MNPTSTKYQKIFPWIIAAVVMFPTAIEILDTTVANVALPYIAGGLATSVDESTWILTSYIISNAVMLPITYWFSDKLGRKNYLLLSIIVFTIGSLMCGFATSLEELVLFRIIQGLGGGGLTPLSQSILLEVFPKEKHGQAMGFFGFGILLAPIIGPYLGGWLSDNYSWHWIFFINIPLGILAFILVKKIIPKSFNNNKNKSSKIDAVGLGLLVLFIGSLQIVLDKGQEYDWFASNFILSFTTITIVAFIILIYWLLKSKSPLIKLHIFKNWNFTFAVISLFINGFVFYGLNMTYPLFLEKLMGYNATTAGQVSVYSGIAVMFAMPITGWLTSKYNQKIIALTGIVLYSIGLYKMSGLTLQANFEVFALYRSIFGVGLALMWIPITTLAFSTLNKTLITQGTGISNLARSIGGSIGISVASTLSIRRAQIHQNILIGHTNILNHQFTNSINALQQSLQTTYKETCQIVYNTVLAQAQLLAYLDVFKFLLLLSIATIPFVLFIKYKRNTTGKVQITH
jgi:MFS transporter, DHA2 family, multidrug resistance protein